MHDLTDKLPIGVGLLSWRAPRTIDNTLSQYGDFKSYFAEFRAFFQECSSDDEAVALKYGVDYIGRRDNVGIQAGMRWVVENLRSEIVLYLENDFNLLVGAGEAAGELKKALEWICRGDVDIVRLRSLFRPGEPCGDPEKYSSVYLPKDVDPRFEHPERLGRGNAIVRLFRPFKCRRIAARSAYVERAPEKRFPRIFRRDDIGLITTSSHLNWTNNPVLIRRDLFLRIADYADAHPSHRTVGGFQDFEKPLNCRWWRAQRFRIGLTDGIFTHNRIDR